MRLNVQNTKKLSMSAGMQFLNIEVVLMQSQIGDNALFEISHNSEDSTDLKVADGRFLYCFLSFRHNFLLAESTVNSRYLEVVGTIFYKFKLPEVQINLHFG